MSRSFMILFMVFVETKLNFAFNFEFFPYCFYTWVKGKFLIMELIVSFPDDIAVSSGQLKRFNESVIDPKCLLKVKATSFCFNNNLSFSNNIIFSSILLFLFEKDGLHASQNSLQLQSTISFSKYCNLHCLFGFATRFRCRLNLTMSIGFFILLALFLRRALIIICS